MFVRRCTMRAFCLIVLVFVLPCALTSSVGAQAFDAGVADGSVPVVVEGLDGAVPAVAPVEVTVRAGSGAQRIRESADAVTVIELGTSRRQAADVGEVLARNEGINVRRVGGLGSEARLSLNGLTDDQIRFFYDDVPLELAGFVQGFANLPWLLLDQVVVYRGVVPIRLSADALGGAIHLTTRQPTRGWGGEASYQVGSFGTHRATLSAFGVHRPTGVFGRISLYLDASRNDFEIDAPVADASGSVEVRRVRRFHDDYRAYGAAGEIGVLKKSWAERLILRVFGMHLQQALQTNLIQSVPYGEAEFDRSSVGGTLRYHQPLAQALRLEALAGYTYAPTNFRDESPWVYDWLGNRVAPDRVPGETSPRPIRQTFWQHNTFARAQLNWKVADTHELQLAVMPTYVQRSGKDHLRTEGRDPLADTQRLLSMITGLAYKLSLFDDRLENVLFGKSYGYRTWAEQTAPNGVRIERDHGVAPFGGGDALRLRITDSLYTKGSYELATRLPRPEETFGDGVLVNPNLQLKEETSHNGNLELSLRAMGERAGEVRASANLFVRKIDNQILLIGTARDTRYENVYGARSRGVEGSLGWTSPGHYLTVDANSTYVDLRNTSSKGTFGRYKGDRIPNRPYLFANVSARGAVRNIGPEGDELSLTWYMRYVHQFYRSWQRDGDPDTKQVVPKQITHAIVWMYSLTFDRVGIDAAVDIQNFTNALAFDNFGAQRPGRSYWFKLSARR